MSLEGRPTGVRTTMTENREPQVILVDGDMDFTRTPAFRRTLLDAVTRGCDILVDFSEATHIDSSGIACLIEALQAALSRGVGLALVSVDAPVLRMLRLARLDAVFPIHDDFAAAVERG
jgi:anti-sigma B factor antagonist